MNSKKNGVASPLTGRAAGFKVDFLLFIRLSGWAALARVRLVVKVLDNAFLRCQGEVCV